MDDKNAVYLENARKLETLKDNSAFNLYLDILKSKKREFESVLKHPKPIGLIEKRNNGLDKYEYFKYTKEDDTERLKEAQLRCDTFERCIALVDDWIEKANIILKQEEEAKKKKAK